MTKITISDLMELQVLAILKKLRPWMFPLQSIIEEITIIAESDNLILVGENKERMRFDREYIATVRKTFKCAEWFLGQPKEKGTMKGLSLLIGVLPQKHYIVLACKKIKYHGKRFEE